LIAKDLFSREIYLLSNLMIFPVRLRWGAWWKYLHCEE